MSRKRARAADGIPAQSSQNTTDAPPAISSPTAEPAATSGATAPVADAAAAAATTSTNRRSPRVRSRPVYNRKAVIASLLKSDSESGSERDNSGSDPDSVSNAPRHHTSSDDDNSAAGSESDNVSEAVSEAVSVSSSSSKRRVLKQMIEDEDYHVDSESEEGKGDISSSSSDDARSVSSRASVSKRKSKAKKKTATKKKSTAKPRKSRAKAKKNDGEENDEEKNDDGEVEEGDEDTKKKKKTKAPRKASAKTKRTPKKKKDADGAEDGEADDEDKVETKREVKPKKVSSKPRKTPIVQQHLEPKLIRALNAIPDDMSVKSTTPETTCCPRCSSHEVFRAVNTKDMKLLDEALSDVTHVAQPFLQWSADCTRTPMHAAIDSGDRFLVRKLLHALNVEEWSRSSDTSSYYHHARSAFSSYQSIEQPPSRCTIPSHAHLKKDSGTASFIAYGHKIRAVQISRGGREGNNAFLDDEIGANDKHSFISYLEYLLQTSRYIDLLQEFISAIDPKRTTYKNAMESLKDVMKDGTGAKPSLQKQPTKHMLQLNAALQSMQQQQPVVSPFLPPAPTSVSTSMFGSTSASSTISYLQSLSTASTSEPVFDIYTRENEVYSYLTSQGLVMAAIAGNTPMVRQVFHVIQRRSHMSAPESSPFTSTSFGVTYVAGFNVIHAEVLAPVKASEKWKGFTEADKVKSISATKKAQGNESISPVHLAAIVSDTSRLDALFAILGPSLLHVTDSQQRTPIFYAAACKESTAPLEWLIAKGANIYSIDATKQTPLDYAVSARAANNIPLLVPQVPNTTAPDYVPPMSPQVAPTIGDTSLSLAPIDGSLSLFSTIPPFPVQGSDDADLEMKSDNDRSEQLNSNDEVDESSLFGSPSKRRRVGGGRRRRGAPKVPRVKKVKAPKVPKVKHIVYIGPTMPSIQSSINQVDQKSGLTLLHRACSLGHAPTVEALLRCGANMYALDKEKRSPLVTACKQGHTQIVKAIYARLKELYPDDEKGFKAALKKTFLAVDRLGRTVLVHAVKNGHHSLVKALVVDIGVPIYPLDTSDNSLVMYAAAYGWSSILRLLLVIVSSDPDGHAASFASKTNIWKMSPLFIAMMKSHMRTASIILEQPNIDVNARDSDGSTILHHIILLKPHAVERCYDQMRFFIDERHADVTLREPKKQQNLLHMLCAMAYENRMYVSDGESGIEWESRKEKQKVSTEYDRKIVDLLIRGGIDINTTDASGESPLLIAFQQVNLPLVEYLLSKGARVNVCNVAGQLTPAMICVEMNRQISTKETTYTAARVNRRNGGQFGAYFHPAPTSVLMTGTLPSEPASIKSSNLDGDDEEEQSISINTTGWTPEEIAAKTVHEALVQRLNTAWLATKQKVLKLILEAGEAYDQARKLKGESVDDVIDPSQKKAQDVTMVEEKKLEEKYDEEEKYGEDEDEDEDKDEDEDEGNGLASRTPSPAPPAVALTTATFEPCTIHYLNGVDTSGRSLLLHIASTSTHAYELLNFIFTFTNRDGGASPPLNLSQADHTGSSLLFHIIRSTRPIRLLKCVFAYTSSNEMLREGQIKLDMSLKDNQGKTVVMHCVQIDDGASTLSSTQRPRSLRLLTHLLTFCSTHSLPLHLSSFDNSHRHILYHCLQHTRGADILALLTSYSSKHDVDRISYNSSDADGQTILFSVVALDRDRASSYLRILLKNYTKFDLSVCDKVGTNIWLHVLKHQGLHSFDLINSLLDYALAKSTQVERAQSFATVTYTDGETWWRYLLTHVNSISPCTMYLILHKFNAAGVIDLAKLTPHIMLQRKHDAPPPLKWYEEVTEVTQSGQPKVMKPREVPFQWNMDELRRAKLIDRSTDAVAAERIDSKRYEYMVSELPHCRIVRTPFWTLLLSTYFSLMSSSFQSTMHSIEIDRCRQWSASFIQTMKTTLRGMKQTMNRDEFDQLLTNSSSHHPTLYHHLISHHHQFDIYPFLQLITDIWGDTSLLQKVGAIRSTDGMTPLLYLARVALEKMVHVREAFTATTMTNQFTLDELEKVQVKEELPSTPPQREHIPLIKPFRFTPSRLVDILSHYLTVTSTPIDQPIFARIYDHTKLQKRIRRGWKEPEVIPVVEEKKNEDQEMEVPTKEVESEEESDSEYESGVENELTSEEQKMDIDDSKDSDANQNVFNIPSSLRPSPQVVPLDDPTTNPLKWEWVYPSHDELGYTFLHFAVQYQCEYVVEQLISKFHANVLIAGTNTGRLPIHIACQVNAHSVTFPRLLLRQHIHAQLIARDSAGMIPLMYCTRVTHRIELIQFLLNVNGGEYAQEQVTTVDKKKRTALHYVVSHSLVRSLSDNAARALEIPFVLEQLLLDHQADINAVDGDGRTCLHYSFIPMDQVYTAHGVQARDPIEYVSDVCAVVKETSGSAEVVQMDTDESSSADDGGRPGLDRARSFLESPLDVCYVRVDVADKYGRTPLHYAAQLGAQIVCKYLRQRGASLRTIDADGNGVFQCALQYDRLTLATDLIDGDVEVQRPIMPQLQSLRDLLEEAKTDSDEKRIIELQQTLTNRLKNGPISSFAHILSHKCIGLAYLALDHRELTAVQAVEDALKTNQLSLVGTLLKKSLPVKLREIRDVDKRNLWHIISDYAPANDASRTAFHSTWSAGWMAQLTRLKISPQLIESKLNATPLHLAIRQKHLPLVQYMLETHHVATTHKEAIYGDTPLLTAVRVGSVAIVRILFKGDNSLQTNVVDTKGDTPLILAVRLGRVDCTEALLTLAPSLSSDTVSLADGESPLLIACRLNSIQLVKTLFQHRPKTKTVGVIGRDGWTPLMIAAKQGNFDIVKLLLHSSIELAKQAIHEQAPDGSTLLHWAVSHHNALAANHLLRDRHALVNPKLDLSRFQPTKEFHFTWPVTKNEKHEYAFRPMEPLQIAYQHQNVDMMKLLLAYGANPNLSLLASDVRCRALECVTTPTLLMQLALTCGIESVEELLLKQQSQQQFQAHAAPVAFGFQYTGFQHQAQVQARTPPPIDPISRLWSIWTHEHDPTEVALESVRLSNIALGLSQQSARIPPLLEKLGAPQLGKETFPNDFNGLDKNGRALIHHLVRLKDNIEEEEELFALNKKQHRRRIISSKHQDSTVEQRDRVRMVVLRSRNGRNIPIDLDLADKFGLTPLAYAYRHASQRMVNLLIELGARVVPSLAAEAKSKRTLAAVPIALPVDWSSHVRVDALADSIALEIELEAKAEKEKEKESLKETPIVIPPVDSHAGDLAQRCRVYADPVTHAVYDFYGTCTDVSYGPYGKHSFYKMQVLFDAALDMPILWTRYGRVGETGNYQQTPFSTIDLSVAEFEKIFRSKTGNVWATQRTEKTFEPKDGKYHLQSHKLKTNDDQDEQRLNAILQPIDMIISRYEAGDSIDPKAPIVRSVPPLRIATPSIASLMKIFCDVSLVRAALRRCGYTTATAQSELVEKNLKKSVLESGMKKLKEIATLIPQLKLIEAQLHQQVTIKQQMEYAKHQYERQKEQAAAEEAARQARKEAEEEAKKAAREARQEADGMGEEDEEEKKEDEDTTMRDITPITTDSSPPDSVEPVFDFAPIESKIIELQSRKMELDELLAKHSNSYYQLIPQPGVATTSIRAFTDLKDIQAQMSQILTFVELHITRKLVLASRYRISMYHPCDYVYCGLGIYLTRLKRASMQYRLIQQYVFAEQSHESLEIYHIYSLARRGEAERFKALEMNENRKLLWHGSSLVNFNGIMAEGLRIAPPEADVSGYMYGKGVYFADRFSKSYGYCRDASSGQVGQDANMKCLLLCEVNLGKEYHAHHAQYMAKPPEGYDSTHALASQGPDDQLDYRTSDGCIVPIGPIVQRSIPPDWNQNPNSISNSNYFATSMAEYIVYDEAQVQMRYLVCVGPPRVPYTKWLRRCQLKEKRRQLRRAKKASEIRDVI